MGAIFFCNNHQFQPLDANKSFGWQEPKFVQMTLVWHIYGTQAPNKSFKKTQVSSLVAQNVPIPFSHAHSHSHGPPTQIKIRDLTLT
jgi:hypothetical protein